jgi:hypothetical protein
MVCGCRYSVQDQHTIAVSVGDTLWKCKTVKCGDDTLINVRLRGGWNWLRISVSGWILYYLYQAFRFGFLEFECYMVPRSWMIEFCSTVLPEEVLSPEIISERFVVIISPICFFFLWLELRNFIYLFIRLFPSMLTQQFHHPAIVWITHITEWHFVILSLLFNLCRKHISLKTSIRSFRSFKARHNYFAFFQGLQQASISNHKTCLRTACN